MRTNTVRRRDTRKLTPVVAVLVLTHFAAHRSFAVPALRTMRAFTQPDGTKFQARVRGDEWFHWVETGEGRPAVLDLASGYWVYALSSGIRGLSLSNRKVGVHSPPTGPFRPAAPAEATQRRLAASRKVVSPTGAGNLPVVLVNFADRSATFGASAFDGLLFGTGNKSMKDLYSEMSYGKFTVSAGPGGVVGWYMASKGHDYYGQDVAGEDAHPAELVIEAVKAADRAGFHFAPYDQNGDGYVDVVNIIHQGTGQEAGGPSTDIWSHRWDLNSAKYWGDGTGEYLTNDGVKVNDYVIQPELLTGTTMSTVGVFCHEYGHALGLPDLYDTDSTSEGLGDWSLMAAGSWNGTSASGDTPAHMDVWCKSKLGWLTPVRLSSDTTGASIQNVETNSVAFRLWTAGVESNEYFLVENRQRVGFDSALPGSGLLLYHVDEAQTSNNKEWYPGHTSSGHYLVALEQADGLWNLEKGANRGDSGDPYPGSQTNRTFDDSSVPDSRSYAGTSVGVAVRNISDSGLAMTADISVAGGTGGCDPPPAPFGPSPSDGATNVPLDTDLIWNAGGEGASRVLRGAGIRTIDPASGPELDVGTIHSAANQYILMRSLALSRTPDSSTVQASGAASLSSCPVTYDVYFGTSNPPTTLLCQGVSPATCDAGQLASCAKYYWQVVAKNSGGQTPGPVWSFTTVDTYPPEIASPAVNPRSLPAGGGPVTISATVSDLGTGIATVAAIVTRPGGSTEQVLMSAVAATSAAVRFEHGVSDRAREVLDDLPGTVGKKGARFDVARVAKNGTMAERGRKVQSVVQQTPHLRRRANPLRGEERASTAPTRYAGTYQAAANIGELNLTYHVRIEAKDSAENFASSDPPDFVVLEGVPPAVPFIVFPTGGSTLHNAKPTITGAAEAGANVEVLDGSTSLGTVTADSGGNWSLTPTSALAEGSHSLTAKAKDAAGNMSATSPTLAFTIDTAGPSAPVIAEPANGALLNTARPVIRGTAEAGATVEVFDGSTSLGTVTADSGGNWSLTPTSALAEGSHSLTAKAKDAAGNVSAASPSLMFTIDTAGPSAPVIAEPANGALLNTARPVIRGTAEAGATVEVFDGSTSLGTVTADGGGNWSLTPASALAEGSHSLTAKAKDAAGNVSAASQAATFTVDAVAPSAPVITKPANGPYVNMAKPVIEGTAEARAAVEVFEGNASLGTAAADSGGNWSLTPPIALAEGAHTLTAIATDTAGNISAVSQSATFTVDTVAPAAPAIAQPSNGAVVDTTTPIIGGTVEAGAMVEVFESATGVGLGRTTGDSSGEWSLTPASSLTDGQHSIEAKATDAAGNTSAPSAAVTFTADMRTLFPPVITQPTNCAALNTTRPVIAGTARPHVTVQVFEGKTTLGTTTVDTGGLWSFAPVKALAQGSHTVTAKATDTTGKVSAASQAVTFTVDTKRPKAPAITKPKKGAAVNSAKPVIEGTAEPGATVEVFDGSVSLGTTTADRKRKWSLTPGKGLSEGQHAVTGRATDAAGNVSTASKSVTFTVDTTPPTVTACSATTKNVKVVFSESVNTTDVKNKSNYALTVGGAATTVSSVTYITYSSGSRTATLWVNATLQSGAAVSVRVTGVRDLAGNVIVDNGTTNVGTTTVPKKAIALRLSNLRALVLGRSSLVQWVLTSEALVQVRILNPEGRLLHALGPVPARAGLNALSWDGRMRNGRLAGRGRYLIEILAQGEDGHIVRATRTLTLR